MKVCLRDPDLIVLLHCSNQRLCWFLSIMLHTWKHTIFMIFLSFKLNAGVVHPALVGLSYVAGKVGVNQKRRK